MIATLMVSVDSPADGLASTVIAIRRERINRVLSLALIERKRIGYSPSHQPKNSFAGAPSL
jgi:hypothetical protein